MIQPDPRITLALMHREEINKKKNAWASFECMSFPNYQIIMVHSGIINSRGEPERKDVTRYYFNDNGIPYYRIEVHP